MNIIKSIITYLIKLLILSAITLTISVSLLQRKFPPDVDAFYKQIKFIQNLQAHTMESLKQQSVDLHLTKNNLKASSNDPSLEEKLKLRNDQLNQFLLNLDKQSKELKDLHSNTGKAEKMDFLMLKNKVNISEQKIKVLEYEVRQLKNQIRILNKK